MKTFPKIVLDGDRARAATYIRTGRQELSRTKDLAQRMGVPTYERQYRPDDYTLIRTLVEGEQEIIYIEHLRPEEIPEEEGEEEEEEEEKGCEPGFLVYDYSYLDYSGQEPPPTAQHGLLLYWDDKRQRWAVDDIPYLNGGSAGWFHADHWMDRYFNPDILGKCSVVSYFGLDNGMWGKSSDRYSYHYGKFYSRRTSAVYTGGTGGSVGSSAWEVLGACYKPHFGDKQDYFYALLWNPDDYELIITQTECDDTVWKPKTGTSTVLATFSGADVAAATGLSGDVGFLGRPGQLAYVDEYGKAFLGINISAAKSLGDNTTHYPWYSSGGPGYLFNDHDYVCDVYTGLDVVVQAEFDLQQGTAKFEIPTHSRPVAFSRVRNSLIKNCSVVNAGAYNNITLNFGFGECVSGENDYIRVNCPDSKYKTPLELNVRKGAEFAFYERCSTGSGPCFLTYGGGCEDKFEYQIRIEHSDDSSSGGAKANGTAVNNPLYNPDLGPEKSLQKVPIYTDEGSNGFSGVNHKLIVERLGPQRKDYTLCSYHQTATEASRSQSIVNSNPDRIQIHSQMYDSQCFFTPEPWFGYPYNSWDITWNSSGETWMTSVHQVFGKVDGSHTHTKVIFEHPGIPDLKTYMELVVTGVGGVGATYVLSYVVEYKGSRSIKWSVSAAESAGDDNEEPRDFGGKLLQFSNYWPGSTAGEVTGSGEWVYSVNYDVHANAVFVAPMEYGAATISVNGLTPSFASSYNWNWCYRFGYNRLNARIGDINATARFETETLPFDEFDPVMCAVHKRGYGPNKGVAPYMVYLCHPKVTDYFHSASGDSRVSMIKSMNIGDDPDANNLAYMPLVDPRNPEGCDFYSNFISEGHLKNLVRNKLGENMPEGFPINFPAGFGVI